MAPIRKEHLAAAVAAALLGPVAAAAPALHEDQLLIQGIVSGSQTVTAPSTDSVRAEFSYNDRGRGPHIIATWQLDAAGIPTEYSGTGNDYMKAAVTESFRNLGRPGHLAEPG